MILKIFHENGFWGTKNCSTQNVKVGVAMREKIFQMSSEFKLCFGRRLWVRGYPQNQTGYPYDAWNDFYRTKRAEVAIFWFSTPQKAIFKLFFAKKQNFWAIIGSDVLREDAKIIFVMIFLPSNKFPRDSLSLKLSNKVRGVIWNRMNPFLITQTCGGGDFSMFWNFLKSFFYNYAEIACKKLCFSKQQGKCFEAWKKFWNHFRIQNFFWNTCSSP